MFRNANKMSAKLIGLCLVSMLFLVNGTHSFALETSDENVISTGDKLTISVLEQESISGSYIVYGDGSIEFPYITEGVKAAGMTHKELADKISRELEKDHFYKATVKVRSYRKDDMYQTAKSSKDGVVYVYGQAARTGIVEIPAGQVFTVSKVIITAGGFKDFANKRQVKLIRRSPSTGRVETKIFNMVNIIDRGKLDEDEPVQDGDIIVVPEQFFNF